jgi:hypothetical protein
MLTLLRDLWKAIWSCCELPASNRTESEKQEYLIDQLHKQNDIKYRLLKSLQDELFNREDSEAVAAKCDLAQRLIDQLNNQDDIKSAATKSRLFQSLMQEGMKNIPEKELKTYKKYYRQYKKSWKVPHPRSIACRRMYTMLYWLYDVPTLTEPNQNDVIRSVEASGGTGSPGSIEVSGSTVSSGSVKASMSDDLDDDNMSNLTQPHGNTANLKLAASIDVNTLLIVKLHDLKHQMSLCSHCNRQLTQINNSTKVLYASSVNECI